MRTLSHAIRALHPVGGPDCQPCHREAVIWRLQTRHRECVTSHGPSTMSEGPTFPPVIGGRGGGGDSRPCHREYCPVATRTLNHV